MNLQSLTRRSEFEWCIESTGQMRVPGIIYAGEQLIRDMDEKVREQLTNVATLPESNERHTQCRMLTGATVFQLAAWLRLIPMKVE
jgi:hypothetical protein